jgi:hypothetical protein
MSRRKTSNPISLFSFQDIITSVTGIMILVTLLIALELSQRALDSPRVQTAIVNKQVEETVQAAEHEIGELEAQLAARDATLQQLAGYDHHRLVAESTDAQRQVERLEAETIKLAAQAEDARKRQTQIESRGQARQDDVRLVEELKNKIAELAAKIEKLQSTNRTIYNAANGSAKTAWLVELTGQAIRTAPLGRAAQPTIFSTGSPPETLAAFLQWARSRDSAAEYFVLLIKPSGIETFDQVREELMNLGFELGFDVVDDGETVIDSQTGAGV